MELSFFRKNFLGVLVIGSLFLGGCVSEDAAKTSKRFSTGSGKLGTVTTSGAGAGTTAGSTGIESDVPPKVEIRHLIEPNLITDMTYSSGTGYAGGGTYVRKLTLPKNFAGRLYVAGININTLANRNIKVRFKFGATAETKEVPATVSKAPGITPQTNVDVLILDLKSEPFRNIRLTYDLFDYNDYTPTLTNANPTPVQSNLDSNLYCRGLKLEHDSTFNGIGACDQNSEECLYSYAKVSDQGLLKQTSVVIGGVTTTVFVPVVPSTPQIQQASNGYYGDGLSEILKRPLQDDYTEAGSPLSFLYTISSLHSFNLTDVVSGTPKTLGTLGNYKYNGPYQLLNCAEWSFNRCFYGTNDLNFIANNTGSTWADKKLFRESAHSLGSNIIYYKSLLFPLATKIKNLRAGVSYLGSDSPFDPKVPQTQGSIAGESKWMDGANERVTKNYDGEHIGSCNVSATIEIIAKDDNGNWYVVSESRDVKLQLTRPTQYQTDTGDEVLYNNYKTCNSNSMCGSSECCYNNRCWSETLVSQCIDTSSYIGNKLVGDVCATDMECQSLCCNKTNGKCAVHNTILTPPVLCQKPIGEFCIATEWCQKTPVTTYLIVKTGTDPSTGAVTCTLRSYTKLEYGECKNGQCVAPVQSVPPVFDYNNPDCSGAVTAPNF